MPKTGACTTFCYFVLHCSYVVPVHYTFDVARHIKLVPPFRQVEVDFYFVVFERVAGKNWGGQNMCGIYYCSVTDLESRNKYMDCDVVKAAILQAYKLVPKAYRQRYSNLTKTAKKPLSNFS